MSLKAGAPSPMASWAGCRRSMIISYALPANASSVCCASFRRAFDAAAPSGAELSPAPASMEPVDARRVFRPAPDEAMAGSSATARERASITTGVASYSKYFAARNTRVAGSEHRTDSDCSEEIRCRRVRPTVSPRSDSACVAARAARSYPLPVWTYIGPTWDCNVSVTSVTAHLSATLTGHDGEAYIYHISRAQVGLISGLSRCECVIHSKKSCHNASMDTHRNLQTAAF